MRIRVDGDPDLAQEARLALRFAGFVVVEDEDVDWRITLRTLSGKVTRIELLTVDCPLERLLLNRLAQAFDGPIVVNRHAQQSDRAAVVQLPATSELSRLVSLALADVFLGLLSQPSAYAAPVDRAVTLVDTIGGLVRDLTAARSELQALQQAYADAQKRTRQLRPVMRWLLYG